MDLLINWLIGPIVLIVVAVGLSLLVERLADLTVPWTIRPALGLTAAIVVAQILTVADETAELAVPAILVLAVVGLLLGWGHTGSRPSGWALGAAGLVFAVFAAPFVVLGDATWSGFIKLDDTATFMGLIDHTFEFGRGVGGLAPSTHEAMIVDLGGNYPIGSITPAAVTSRLLAQDPAWTLMPSLAVAPPVMCLLIFELVRRLVRTGLTAFGIAVIGSLSATLMGYYLWGGVKELMAAALLPLGPALVGHGKRLGWPRTIWVPIAVSIAGFIGVLGAGGGVWLLPTLLPALIVLVRERGRSEALAIAGPALGLAVVLALPILITPDGLLNPLSKNFIENTVLGNLTGPLNLFHISGIWPSLDFRSDPGLKPAVLVLGGLCIALAAGAVLACTRIPSGEGLPFASYAGGGAVGAVVVILAGSPWIDGKAMAILSPAVLAGAMLATALIAERSSFRFEAAALAAVIGGVTLWSAYLAYHGVWFAPRSHFTELEHIGKQFAGTGPTLSTEAPSYGPRHFLRNMDAEGATDLRRRPVLLLNGAPPPKGQYLDLDQIRPDQLDPYQTLVIRRGPATSRPPASFELAYSGEYYEVWRRTGHPPGSLVVHVPLSSDLGNGGTLDCNGVAALAKEAGKGGSLVAARASTPTPVDLSAGESPESWNAAPTGFIPTGSGTLTTSVDVSKAGDYELWLGGYIFGGLEVRVDGTEVGSKRAVINSAGGYEPLGTVALNPGRHTVELDYDRGILQPGTGGGNFGIGPLMMDSKSDGDLGTVTVPASDYRRLCGRRWDWIEAYS